MSDLDYYESEYLRNHRLYLAELIRESDPTTSDEGETLSERLDDHAQKLDELRYDYCEPADSNISELEGRIETLEGIADDVIEHADRLNLLEEKESRQRTDDDLRRFVDRRLMQLIEMGRIKIYVAGEFSSS